VDISHKSKKGAKIRMVATQKASHKKTTGLPTFSFSTISPSYFFLITQRIFIAETCARVRWKGNLLRKNQKKKKQTTTTIFNNFHHWQISLSQ
jgi:hypothetical protein